MSWPSSDLGDSVFQADQGSLSSEKQIADGIATVDLSGRIPQPKLPCHILNANPASVFVGRDEIIDILDKQLLPRTIEEPKTSPQSYALCGIGGLGKSEIAMQLSLNVGSHSTQLFSYQLKVLSRYMRLLGNCG
jgi:hypothetical protein